MLYGIRCALTNLATPSLRLLIRLRRSVSHTQKSATLFQNKCARISLKLFAKLLP